MVVENVLGEGTGGWMKKEKDASLVIYYIGAEEGLMSYVVLNFWLEKLIKRGGDRVVGGDWRDRESVCMCVCIVGQMKALGYGRKQESFYIIIFYFWEYYT